MPDSTPFSLRGIYPPLVTPLTHRDNDLQLDVESLGRLVEHTIAGGVAGLFALGTTGETPSLPLRLKRAMVKETCRLAAGRVPVLVGVTDTCLEVSLELAEVAKDHGAACVVAAPPFYYPVNQQELLGYYRSLVEALPLPLLLYNIPSCTKTALAVDTVAQLADHPNIIGIKDSSRDWDYFSELLKAVGGRDDFSVLIGPEILLARAVQAGAVGGICGGSNMYPPLYVELFEAASARDAQRVAELQAVVERIGETIYTVSDSCARLIQGLKAALANLDICETTMAPPLSPLDEDGCRQVADYVAALGITANESGS